MKKTINYKNINLSVNSEFDLFGNTAFIARDVFENKVCNKFWQVYLKKDNGHYNKMGIKNATNPGDCEPKTIKRLENNYKSKGCRNIQQLTKLILSS